MILGQLIRSVIAPRRRRQSGTRFEPTIAVTDTLESRTLLSVPGPVPITSVETPDAAMPERVIFHWDAVEDATSYEYWVNEVGLGKTAGENVTTNSVEVTLRYGANHAAFVRATNSMGTGPWSTAFDMLPGSEPPGEPPTFAAEHKPADYSNGHAITRWTSDNRTALVDIWISREGQSGPFRRATSPRDSHINSPQLEDGIYTTWLRARNAFGASEWSAPIRRAVGGNQPVVLGPTDNPTVSQPTLTWSPGVPGIPFELWVNQVGGTNRIIHQQNLNETSFTALADLPDGAYNAFIRQKSASVALPWSRAFRFEVGVSSLPGVPQPTGSGSDFRATFDWTAAANGVRYEIWVSDTRVGRVVGDDQITDTTFTTVQLPAGRYRAWLRTFSSADIASAWSFRLDFEISETGVVGFLGQI